MNMVYITTTISQPMRIAAPHVSLACLNTSCSLDGCMSIRTPIKAMQFFQALDSLTMYPTLKKLQAVDNETVADLSRQGSDFIQ